MAYGVGQAKAKSGLLHGARVYLSGPMDFVDSRAEEKKHGWRNRVGQFLREFGVTVFDPWFKPEVRGFHEYGREDEETTRARERWDFAPTPEGAQARAECAHKFWQTLHIDLRMVDTTDFTIAYCPTNIYSVGTPHEIILCRQQRKPVLFVSPRVAFPALDELEAHLQQAGDQKGLGLLQRLVEEVPVKPNPGGVPSLWYMPLVGGDHFFDGFGFGEYEQYFRWEPTPEAKVKRQNPLLQFLERLNERLPLKWDPVRGDYVENDDWLLWDLKQAAGAAAGVGDAGPLRKE